MIHSYRDLGVWRLAMAAAEAVHRYSNMLPREEVYGLAAQSRRAAVPVPSSIARSSKSPNPQPGN